MDTTIENCLAKGLAHIFTAIPMITWGKGDIDDRIYKVRTDLRSGKADKYLTPLTEIVKDQKFNYTKYNFHWYYVRGIWELLKRADSHNILTGPLNSIPKADHSHDKENVFALENNKNSLSRLSVWNKTNMEYSAYLKFGAERIEHDLQEFYPNATCEVCQDSFTPDFMREQYIYKGRKYYLFWPIMPTILLWNGFEGIYNTTSKHD